MSQKHLIGKKIIQIQAPSEEGAYQLQQKISDLIHKDLTPELEKLFDSMVDEDTVIRIDTLSIDIGEISLTQINTNTMAIVNKIIEGLKQMIKAQLFQDKILKQPKISTSKNALDFSKEGHYRWPTNATANLEEKDSAKSALEKRIAAYRNKKIRHTNSSNTNSSSQLKRRHHFNMWLYWLEKGTLPPNTMAPKEPWILNVLETLGIDLDAVEELEKTLRSSKIAQRRLILQHKTEDLKSIIELYTGFIQKDLVIVLQEVKELLAVKNKDIATVTASDFNREFEIKLWQQIFEIIVLQRKKIDSVSLLRLSFEKWITGNVAFQKYIEPLQVIVSNTILEKQYPVLLKVVTGSNPLTDFITHTITEQQISSEREEVTNPSINKRESNEIAVSKSNKEVESNRLTIISKSDQNEKESENVEKETNKLAQDPSSQYRDKDTEVIDSFNKHYTLGEDLGVSKKINAIDLEILDSPQFFNNAGMVLLHPFLTSLFKRLELLEGKDFKNLQAQSKAVILLHFLTTGEEKANEYEMVLPKFLCTMPINAPIDHTISLTKEEKEEATGLLAVVIEHWGALGSTSPDGLREGFLMRQGKLEKEQTGWKLYVEQKTLDILLDRLSWNISLIKLPWMPELLKVEWR